MFIKFQLLDAQFACAYIYRYFLCTMILCTMKGNQSEHVRKAEKIRFLSRRSRWNCPNIGKVREGEMDRDKVTEREIEIMLERRREKDTVREGR